MRVFFVAALLPLVPALPEPAHRLTSPPAFVPAPTQAPSALELRRALNPRDDSATCGWISGRQNQPFTCGSGSSCVYNTVYSKFACCSGDVSSCSFQTTCYGRTAALSSAIVPNGYTRICTDTAAPFCQSWSIGLEWGSSGCGTTNTYFYVSSTWLSGKETATGYTTGVFPNTAAITGGGNPSTRAPAGPSSTGGSSGSTGETNNSNNGSNNNNGNSNTSNASNSSTVNNVGGSLSIGAIVGIVIAGCGAIALVSSIALCIRRNRRHHGNNYDAPTGGYIPPTYPPGPPTPGPGMPPPPPPQSAVSYPTYPPGQVYDPSKQLTQTNVNAHNGVDPTQKTGEWDYINGRHGPPVAVREEDGIGRSEIFPHDAIDERAQRQQMSVVGSQVPPTAVAATDFSHHVQRV